MSRRTQKMIAAVVTLVVLTSASAVAQKNSFGRIRTQLARIPEPDPARYRDIRDAMYWQNPYLLVRREGVELRLGMTRTTMPVESVASALARLPLAGWPYGRVVAVQALSNTSVYRYRILSTRERLLKILQAIGVKAEVWPA